MGYHFLCWGGYAGKAADISFFFSSVSEEKKQKKTGSSFLFSEKKRSKRKPASTRVGCEVRPSFFVAFVGLNHGAGHHGASTPRQSTSK